MTAPSSPQDESPNHSSLSSEDSLRLRLSLHVSWLMVMAAPSRSRYASSATLTILHLASRPSIKVAACAQGMDTVIIRVTTSVIIDTGVGAITVIALTTTTTEFVAAAGMNTTALQRKSAKVARLTTILTGVEVV